MILDSRIGALDRTLGFLFGLARGFVIVVVAYAVFRLAGAAESQPEWVTTPNRCVVLQRTGTG